MSCMIFMGLCFRKPLESKSRPIDGMQYEKIIKVRSFLFPYLIFLIYYHFFLFVEFSHYHKFTLRHLITLYYKSFPSIHINPTFKISLTIIHPFLRLTTFIFSNLIRQQMIKSRYENTKIIEIQLTIEKALEFVGDNSNYQKKRLLILSAIILSLAILTCKIPLMGSKITMLYLFASGAGQVICPFYFSVRTITLSLAGISLFTFAFYPVSQFLTNVGYLGLGFFGRGFFVSSLVYLSEIGGDRFRAWSMIVVFAIWGISPLFSSLEKMLNLPEWFEAYFLIFIPFLVNSYFVLQFWKPSPFYLYTKRMFTEAKQVLNDMAFQNERPSLPYGLEGESQTDQHVLGYKKPTYFDIIHRPVIRKITIPLLVLWVYREYIYFGSFTIIPNLGQEYSKNLLLVSISQTVAVLMSYPIRLKIKRVNAFFGLALIIGICSFISSFTTLSPQCMAKGYVCASKYIYRISIMMIRFSIALIGNILISYTLQIYPSNTRSLGFSLCLGVSSIGSTLMPWINETFMYADLSGFISFFFASGTVLYFITLLHETYGRMRTQNLQELQQSAPIISLQNWATLNF